MSVHFSKKSDEWETPIDFFNNLNAKYKFTLDPCATHENHKCDKYYTKEDDGLSKDWSKDISFVNPPYSDLKRWLEKASHNRSVCLIPARTDTLAFHKYVFGVGEVIFLRGRLKFGGAKNSAPFPSCLVVYNIFEDV